MKAHLVTERIDLFGVLKLSICVFPKQLCTFAMTSQIFLFNIYIPILQMKT